MMNRIVNSLTSLIYAWAGMKRLDAKGKKRKGRLPLYYRPGGALLARGKVISPDSHKK